MGLSTLAKYLHHLGWGEADGLLLRLVGQQQKYFSSGLGFELDLCPSLSASGHVASLNLWILRWSLACGSIQKQWLPFYR